MRPTDKPYKIEKPTWGASPKATPQPDEKLAEKSYLDSVVNLGDEIRRPTVQPARVEPVADKPEDKTEPVSPGTSDSDTPTEPAKPTGTANLGEDFEKFKQKTVSQIKSELEASIEDPKRSVKNSLKFINMLRSLGYPFLYKKVLFTDADNAAIAKLMLDMQGMSERKEEIKLDIYQQSLWKRWNDYQAHVTAVPWTEQEMDLITEVGYLKLAEIKFFRMLMENELILVLLFIEGRRLGAVAGSKLGFDLTGLLKLS